MKSEKMTHSLAALDNELRNTPLLHLIMNYTTLPILTLTYNLHNLYILNSELRKTPYIKY